MAITARWNRLFAPDGRCLDVAMDHGFFGELAVWRGLEAMPAAVRMVADARPDAIQLSPGMAMLLQGLTGRDRPALVLRTDIANVYGQAIPRVLFSRLVAEAVEQAVALDAACVVVNLLAVPGHPELLRECVENVSLLKPRCERLGMPLMVEPLVMRLGASGGPYGVDADADRIVQLVRQAVELGADVVKADPTDDPAEYARVVEAASGRPVLPRGGGRVSDAAILRRTEDLLRMGARGAVYGRNIVQHEHPAAMVHALMGVIHGGQSAEQALAILDGARARA
jgi:class I fructose-bisphosphate aldolase